MKILKYDTHTHLDLYQDFEAKLKYIEKNEIYSIVMTNVPKLYKKYKDKYQNLIFTRFSLGLHPELAVQYGEQLKLFLDYLSESRYIGEIGLDYSKGVSKEQTQIFEKIIESCESFEDKIISIHSRKAATSVIDIVGESKNKIIFHWFTGNNKELERAIDKGYYFSVNSDMLNTKKGKNLMLTVPTVMRRTGLVGKDVDLDSVIYKARELNPDFPGIIDFLCWEIGRTWCRPNNPNCKECIIRSDCKMVL